jgi:FkbM family methyltransferase
VRSKIHFVAVTRLAAKLWAIARSDLAVSGKLRYMIDTLARRLRPHNRLGVRTYPLTAGRSIELRESSTDWRVFEEVFLERIYAPYAAAAGVGSKPPILIDLGANVGLSAIALAGALSPSRIVAVEPEAANFRMLCRNLRLAGLADCSSALRAFAGAEPGFAELHDAGYGAWGMRMGRHSTDGIPIHTIPDIVARARTAGISATAREPVGKVVLKCDIEGSERQLFEQIREWDHLVDFVILELHTEFLSVPEFQANLASSAFHWRTHGNVDSGALLVVIALERLQEKAEALSQAAS